MQTYALRTFLDLDDRKGSNGAVAVGNSDRHGRDVPGGSVRGKVLDMKYMPAGQPKAEELSGIGQKIIKNTNSKYVLLYV